MKRILSLSLSLLQKVQIAKCARQRTHHPVKTRWNESVARTSSLSLKITFFDTCKELKFAHGARNSSKAGCLVISQNSESAEWPSKPARGSEQGRVTLLLSHTDTRPDRLWIRAMRLPCSPHGNLKFTHSNHPYQLTKDKLVFNSLCHPASPGDAPSTNVLLG